MKFLCTASLALLMAASLSAAEKPFPKADGYQGIWFTLGQKTPLGDKYSGGLGTYTTSHVPMAIYAPKVNKTFFVYGGTIPGKRHLLAMIGYYDHATRHGAAADAGPRQKRRRRSARRPQPVHHARRAYLGLRRRPGEHPAGLHLPQPEALRHRRVRTDREARPHGLSAAVVHRGPGLPVPLHHVYEGPRGVLDHQPRRPQVERAAKSSSASAGIIRPAPAAASGSSRRSTIIRAATSTSGPISIC